MRWQLDRVRSLAICALVAIAGVQTHVAFSAHGLLQAQDGEVSRVTAGTDSSEIAADRQGGVAPVVEVSCSACLAVKLLRNAHWSFVAAPSPKPAANSSVQRETSLAFARLAERLFRLAPKASPPRRSAS